MTLLERNDFLRAGMKWHTDDGSGRILLGDNTGSGGHAAADQFPMCWSLDFNWTPFCCTMHLTVCIFITDLRKIRPALDLSECNYCCKSGSVCVIEEAFCYKTGTKKVLI